MDARKILSARAREEEREWLGTENIDRACLMAGALIAAVIVAIAAIVVG